METIIQTPAADIMETAVATTRTDNKTHRTPSSIITTGITAGRMGTIYPTITAVQTVAIQPTATCGTPPAITQWAEEIKTKIKLNFPSKIIKAEDMATNPPQISTGDINSSNKEATMEDISDG